MGLKGMKCRELYPEFFYGNSFESIEPILDLFRGSSSEIEGFDPEYTPQDQDEWDELLYDLSEIVNKSIDAAYDNLKSSGEPEAVEIFGSCNEYPYSSFDGASLLVLELSECDILQRYGFKWSAKDVELQLLSETGWGIFIDFFWEGGTDFVFPEKAFFRIQIKSTSDNLVMSKVYIPVYPQSSFSNLCAQVASSVQLASNMLASGAVFLGADK